MTPRVSAAKQVETPKATTPKDKRSKNRDRADHQSPALSIPSAVKRFSPSAVSPIQTSTRRDTLPTKRSLDSELQKGFDPMSAVPTPVVKPGTRFNPSTATIYMAEGRGVATDTFLNVY